MEIRLKLDEDVYSALRRSPDEFAHELRLATAIHWYGRSEISQEKAAQVAGLDRTDFMLALEPREENVFVVDFADLEEGLQQVKISETLVAALTNEKSQEVLVV